MALYEFKCENCGVINIESHSISSNKKITICQYCGEIAEKIISKSTFILKGKKWASKDGY